MCSKFRLLKAKIAYKYAIMKANKLNLINGRRYFVLMTDTGKLVVMDKSIFYKMRKRGSMPKDITPRMLSRISVYYTPGMFKGKSSPGMAETTCNTRKEKYLKYIQKI